MEIVRLSTNRSLFFFSLKKRSDRWAHAAPLRPNRTKPPEFSYPLPHLLHAPTPREGRRNPEREESMAGAAAASAAAAAVASGISARPVAPRPSPSRARAPRSVVRAAISVEKGEKAYTVEKSEEIFNAAKVTRLLSFLSLLRGDASPRASFRGGGLLHYLRHFCDCEL